MDDAVVEAWGKQLVEQLNGKEAGASQYSLEVEKHVAARFKRLQDCGSYSWCNS